MDPQVNRFAKAYQSIPLWSISVTLFKQRLASICLLSILRDHDEHGTSAVLSSAAGDVHRGSGPPEHDGSARIKALRPGPSGDEKAPNHANYDESKANPYPNVPDPLTMNDGQKVTTPADVVGEAASGDRGDVLEVRLRPRSEQTSPRSHGR